MLVSCCLVSTYRNHDFFAFSCLVDTLQVEYASWGCRQFLICRAVFSRHVLCHFGHSAPFLSFLRPMTQSLRCQCLVHGCIQSVLLLFGSRKTVLVISRSCSAQFLKNRRPLLLPLPMPLVPLTSYIRLSVPKRHQEELAYLNGVLQK